MSLRSSIVGAFLVSAGAVLSAQAATFTSGATITENNVTGTGGSLIGSASDDSGTVGAGTVLSDVFVQGSAGTDEGMASVGLDDAITITNDMSARSLRIDFLIEYEVFASALGQEGDATAHASFELTEEGSTDQIIIAESFALFNPTQGGGEGDFSDSFAFSRTVGSGDTLEFVSALSVFADVGENTVGPLDANASGTVDAKLSVTSVTPLAPVPLPAAAWFLIGGVAALGAIARRRA